MESAAIERQDKLQIIRDQIVGDYLRKTPGSAGLHEKARSVLAGGVSGNLRYFSPYPLYTKSAKGSRMTDVDGNEYIDSFGANGPLLLGHNHPALVEAVQQSRELGALPLNPAIMVECAELVQEIVPCAERIRFLNTGTEAVMTAVRIARAYTGKPGIVKFHGHYHGQDDQFLIGIDASDALFSAGVAPEAPASIHLCRYLDLENLEAILKRNGDIAAVIMDPAMHAGGLWGSDGGKLVALRQLTKRHGVLLIFDEVISGCRLAPGGAQQYYGVTPDMVTMAKALAAGEKLALVAGSAEVMSVVDPLAQEGTPRVFQSGTVNDGPAALASGCAALRTYRQLYEQGDYGRLEQRTGHIGQTLEKTFRGAGIACQVNHLASMLQIHLGGNELSFETAQGHDTQLLELFYLALINEGVMLSLPTSNHIYFSFAHSEEDFDVIEQKINDVFKFYGFDALAEN
jgi:glutamate-1-semialdehyde 2,1-aminomutase